MELRGAPFVDARFLNALVDCGCVGPGTGWLPVADLDAPAYIKTHSHGEFVFDWMWAEAAQRAGIRWYPKLLIAAPFSPVVGPRLGLKTRSSDHASNTLVDIESYLVETQINYASINFCDPLDQEVLEQSRWLKRTDWQFHWQNRGYADFESFLAALKRKPRKNIQAERRKTATAGWVFRWVSGNEASPEELALAHRCYLSTHQLYGNHPALSAAFFHAVAAHMGPILQLCIARADDQDLAVAIFFRDANRLYGRYWGSLVDTRDVHFEACYYQGIEYCIQHQLDWFEPGAQGEHKIKRGFLPQQTHSYHWLNDDRMRPAVADYLRQEHHAVMAYREQLEALNPYAP